MRYSRTRIRCLLEALALKVSPGLPTLLALSTGADAPPPGSSGTRHAPAFC